MATNIFELKRSAFVLWRPGNASAKPKLVIGEFASGNPPTFANEQTFDLILAAGTTDLWTVDASACGLISGKTYHYWFEVTDTSPTRNGTRIRCTDPMAFTVDWRLQAP